MSSGEAPDIVDWYNGMHESVEEQRQKIGAEILDGLTVVSDPETGDYITSFDINDLPTDDPETIFNFGLVIGRVVGKSEVLNSFFTEMGFEAETESE